MTTTSLPRYTWDQAHILQLATAKGCAPLGVPAGTVRAWASRGLITAVGKAPGGAHLYQIGEVAAAADRPRRRAGRPPGRVADKHDPQCATLRREQ